MHHATQLFVTTETRESHSSYTRRYRVGRHHPRRYGADMAICAAQVVEHLEDVVTAPYYQPTAEVAEGVAAIYSVSRVTGEASGVTLHQDVSREAARDTAWHDAQDRAFLVNLTPQGYTCGFLVKASKNSDLLTVAGVDDLMAIFGATWDQLPQDVEDEEGVWSSAVAAAVATLRAAEAAGHLMDQDTADRVAAAELPSATTETVWRTIAQVMLDRSVL